MTKLAAVVAFACLSVGLVTGQRVERYQKRHRLVPEDTLGGGQWCTADGGRQWVYDTGQGGTALEETAVSNAAFSAASQGVLAMGVRDDDGNITRVTNGDFVAFRMDKDGYVYARCK